MSQLLKRNHHLFTELLGNSSKLLPTLTFNQQKRKLNVHEHVGIKLLSENGVNVPRFGVAKTPEEASKIASSLKGK